MLGALWGGNAVNEKDYAGLNPVQPDPVLIIVKNLVLAIIDCTKIVKYLGYAFFLALEK